MLRRAPSALVWSLERHGTRWPYADVPVRFPLLEARVPEMAVEADEGAIRELLATWHRATADGDVDTVLGLMTDDALFLVPGREPFGKSEFEETARSLEGSRIESTGSIEELQISGDWAWMRTRLEVSVTTPEGEQSERSGPTLTILRRRADGTWALARDANLLPPG